MEGARRKAHVREEGKWWSVETRNPRQRLQEWFLEVDAVKVNAKQSSSKL